MTLYDILNLIIAGMGVLFAYLSYKRGTVNKKMINKIKMDFEIIEEYMNSEVSISNSTIGGGWAGGTNINCTASDNRVNIQQKNFQKFKDAKLKENGIT